MENRCLVSVIVPIYNSYRTLSDCITSLIFQSYQNIEIICVDDCSVDNSIEYINYISNFDHRVKLITMKDHLGPGVARNNAIDMSTGEYIFFVDSDDILKLNAISKMVLIALEKKSDIVACKLSKFKDEVIYFENSRNFKGIEGVFKDITFKPNEYKENIFQMFWGGAWCKLIKRQLFIKNRLKFPGLIGGEDFSVIKTLLVLSEKISVINDCLYFQREREDSLEHSKDNNPTAFLDGILYFKMLLEKFHLFDEYKKSYYNDNINRIIYNINSCKRKKSKRLIIDKIKSNSELLDIINRSSYKIFGGY